jgi:hypothetical protein
MANKHVADPNDSLKDEDPLLIDPADEDPEEPIGYDWGLKDEKKDLVFVVPRKDSAKGWKTKDVLGLNGGTLCTDRGELILTLSALASKLQAGRYLGNQTIIDDAVRQIGEETSAERQFAGFRRDYFRKQNLGEYVSHD